MKQNYRALWFVVVGLLVLAGTRFGVAQVADGVNQFVAAAVNSPSDSLSAGVGRGMAVVQATDPLNPVGKTLVAITDYTTHGIHVFEINPSAGHGLPPTIEQIFKSAPVPSSYSTTPRTVAAGDLDNDGNLEFIVPVGYFTSDSARGLYVYEWNPTTHTFGNDTAGPSAIITPSMIDTAYNHNSFGRSEAGLYVGDIDGDGVNELVWGDLVFSFDVAKVYVGSVSGTFESGFWSYSTEYVDSTMTHAIPSANDGYVPFALQRVDNLFGDSKPAILWFGWTNVHSGAAMGAFEATGKNTYAASSVLVVDSTKSQFRVKGHAAYVTSASGNVLYFEKDASGELWAATNITTLANFGSATLTKVAKLSGWNEIYTGDQDHGTGSDGFDLYIPTTTGVEDVEWNQTGNLTDSANFSYYKIFDILKQENYLKYGGAITTIYTKAGMDVDNNGHKDILVANKPGGPTADSTAAGYVTDFPGLFLLEWGDSTMITSVKELQPITPADYRLDQNYPNPFNPTTEISFYLPVSKTIRVKIYNTLGQLVRTLVNNERYSSGHHMVSWNGLDDNGRQVASGAYFYSLEFNQQRMVKKMLLVK